MGEVTMGSLVGLIGCFFGFWCGFVEGRWYGRDLQKREMLEQDWVRVTPIDPEELRKLSMEQTAKNRSPRAEWDAETLTTAEMAEHFYRRGYLACQSRWSIE